MRSIQALVNGTAIALLVTVSSASAQTATLTHPGPDLRTTVKYNSYNGSSLSSYSQGALQLSDGSSTFWAYCIDPNTNSSFNPSEVYAVRTLDQYLDGTAGSNYATQLSRAGYTGTAVNSPTALSTSTATQAVVKLNLMELFSHAYSDSLLSATNAAAFGMALWEVIMQDGTSGGGSSGFAAGSGRVRTSGSDLTYDNNDAVEQRTKDYLAALSNGNEATGWGALGLGTTSSWTYTVYYDTQSPFAQTFIKVTPGLEPGPSIPEPGTMLLAGLALAVAVGGRYKKRV